MSLSPRRVPRFAATALSICLLLSGCVSNPMLAPTTNGPSHTPHSTWYEDVEHMAEADDNAGRRAYLRERLETAGMTVVAQPFVSGKLQGENLIADVGGAENGPMLLIGAHSDRVAVGRGATDNASGSAAVLALVARLRSTPLAHHRVKVVFWDLEERGLLGARAYIEQDSEKPALYINFDVFGWGDSLWMMSRDLEHPLVTSSRDAAKAQRLLISAGEHYPPSDHLAFLKAGWPAVSYSLVDAWEIPNILTVFQGEKPAEMPKVMAVIHTPNDTLVNVDDAAVAKGIDAVEAAIRAWDARTQ